MKKFTVLVALLCVVVGFASAETTNYSKNGMFINPGSINANVGIGFGYWYGLSVGGGVEYAIGKFTIAEKLPFTYGVAGRAGLYIGSTLDVAVGAVGTLHFNWGALDLPSELAWIGNFDSYFGLGLSILPSVGFNTIGGTSYFLSENFAINAETGLEASYIGVLLKL